MLTTHTYTSILLFGLLFHCADAAEAEEKNEEAVVESKDGENGADDDKATAEPTKEGEPKEKAGDKRASPNNDDKAPPAKKQSPESKEEAKSTEPEV